MNFYALQLHKYILGETRVDGWKSGWRIEQERRRAEEMGKRVFVRQAVKPAEEKRVYGTYQPRYCEVCNKAIRHDNITGRCVDHKPFKQPVPRKVCPYTGCGRAINHKNLYGICGQHFHQFRGLLRQTEVRLCMEPNCFYALKKSCKVVNRCREHAKDERRLIENARMRKVRALARAA